MKSVYTVLGSIPPRELGITMIHEHLLMLNKRLLLKQKAKPLDARSAALANAPIDMEHRDALIRAPRISKINLQFDDVAIAAKEVKAYRSAGGRTVVDLTPKPKTRLHLLKELSKRSRVQIVASTGYYTEESHPSWVGKASTEQLASEMISDITEGIDGTEIRAGAIGEIGTSAGKITSNEEKVLRAAARAQLKTGAPLDVHLSTFWEKKEEERQARRVLDILEDEGVEMDRICLSHMDETYCQSRNWDYALEIAERGCYLGFDSFGTEWPYAFNDYRVIEPTDYERVLGIKELIERGHLDRLLLSQDMGTRLKLKTFGGWGFDHILVNIVPLFRHVGLSERMISAMLVGNPRNFLPF